MESLSRCPKAPEAPTTTTASTSQEPITTQGRRAARWPRRYRDCDIIGRPPRSLASTRLPCPSAWRRDAESTSAAEVGDVPADGRADVWFFRPMRTGARSLRWGRDQRRGQVSAERAPGCRGPSAGLAGLGAGRCPGADRRTRRHPSYRCRAWRPVALVLAVALAFPLLWRRTHPLAVVAVLFGALIVLNLVTLVDGPGHIRRAVHDDLRVAGPLRVASLGVRSRGHDRVADHRGRRRARDRERLQRLRRSGSGLRVPHVPRSSRRLGPLLDDVANSRDRPGEVARARAARAGAARHRGAPRLGDGHPGAGGTGGRPVGPGSGARCAPGHRGRRLPYPRRDADHGGRAARSRGRRPRPAERRCRHRAARAQPRRRATGAGAPHRRSRRAQPGGRGGHLPHRPGVGDERPATRAQRHPDRRAGRRRGGRRAS